MGTKLGETELHIGNRVLAARLLRGLSQDSLARQLDITHEQLGEFERGNERISSGRLYDIARVLRVDVSYFYEGLGSAAATPFSMSADLYELLKRTLQQIAADHVQTEKGDRKRLPRHEAIRVARETCQALGWDYSKASLGKD